jgi:hypothetical protein
MDCQCRRFLNVKLFSSHICSRLLTRVFSIFILGFFEDKPPRHLSWFMESDIVTVFFHLLSLTPPQYHTDEVKDYRLRHVGHLPPISGYQIMTILAVSTFGIIKAYLSYRELSRGANAVDWILGVIITSW